ncbi:MAG: hypothetical protein OEU84_08445 [Xanthomonadales bacterium]|nr:hypothetical protein [Xanthomonadales bacterium]
MILSTTIDIHSVFKSVLYPAGINIQWVTMLEMTRSVFIDRRFHGPPNSGNGGYSCAMIGKLIDGPAAVRLRIPPPLDAAMELRQSDGLVELFCGDELVASGHATNVDIDIPTPPDFSGAQAASARYRGFVSHFYPGCFVCGPEREHGDGLRVFAGPLEEGTGPEGMVAAAWIPDATLVDSSGFVAPEFIWAALDCPGAYAFPEPVNGALLLGELAVSISGSVKAGEKCVLTGWEINRQGRKHYTGTALFGESGSCRAVAYATWFEVPLQTN